MRLFTTKLSDKRSWLTARETDGYTLVNHIAKKEHLSGDGYRLNPSTNLIYRFDNKILKVYAPAVCGYQALEDFNRELFGLVQLQEASVRVPHILGEGCIHDQYDFYYLVMERLDILPASEFLHTCSLSQLSRFGGALLGEITRFKSIHIDINLAKKRVFNSQLRQERDAILKAHELVHNPQFVHADLSGNNVLYDGKRLAIIDFEDWTYGAAAIEYPEIVFGLLKGTKANIEAFFSRPLTPAFIDEIFEGLLSHYNWERFITDYCMRNNRQPTSLIEARAAFLANV